MAFCLQHHDGGDDEDSRLSVRKHVPHDVFRRLRQLIALNEDPHLFFQRGVAAPKLGQIKGLRPPSVRSTLRIPRFKAV